MAMRITKPEWLGIVVALLIAGATFTFAGWRAGLVCFGLAIIVLFVWHHAREPEKLPDSDTWKELATRFSRLDVNLEAEWMSESLDMDGKPVGDTWRIRGPYQDEQCEALCQLAGAMLMKSPKLRARLSDKVISRTNDAWRWLYFLAEHPGVARDSGYGDVTVRGFKKEMLHRTIKELAAQSHNACIRCAAREV